MNTVVLDDFKIAQEKADDLLYTSNVESGTEIHSEQHRRRKRRYVSDAYEVTMCSTVST